MINVENVQNYAELDTQGQEKLRDFVKSELNRNIVNIQFEKSDGTLRTLHGTTSTDHGAVYTVNENTEKTKTPNPNVCVVWDTAIGAWRSFRWDRLKSIDFNLELDEQG